MPTFRSGKPHIVLGLLLDLPITLANQSVPWEVVDASEGWSWNPLTPQLITVPRSGLYMVGIGWGHSALSASVAVSATTLINGGVSQARESRAPTTSVQRGGVDHLHQLVTNDTIELRMTFPGPPTGNMLQASMKLFAVRVGPQRWTG